MPSSPATLNRWLAIVATVLAAVAGVLAVLSWFDPQWVEGFFESSPDNGSGSTEWTLALAPALVAALLGGAARREWRLARTVPARG